LSKKQGGVVKRTLAVVFVMMVAATVVAVAGPLSGLWSTSIQFDLQTFSMIAESEVVINYSFSGCTMTMAALMDEHGIDNVFFDTSGVLGGFALRSILDFNASAAQFRSMLTSVETAIGGINLYGIFMLDNVGTTQTPSMGSGFTLGGWDTIGDVTFWGQAQFNMDSTAGLIYKYGYAWLVDHFIYEVCDYWQKPSGYIDVQDSNCNLCWSGADLLIDIPYECFDLLAQMSFSRLNGFDQLLLEFSNIDLGLGFVQLKWMDITFTTTSKTFNTVFDLSIGDTVCIMPYIALEGVGTELQGFSLKALKLEYSWEGITFKAGHMFDTDGWYPYLNYLGTRYYGWTWDGELATLPICAVPSTHDEYFGLEIDGDSCCGGSYDMSVYSWFDTGDSDGLFDWIETRAELDVGIGSNVTLSFGLSVTQTGADWIEFGTEVLW
jgi:hypothetical protein